MRIRSSNPEFREQFPPICTTVCAAWQITFDLLGRLTSAREVIDSPAANHTRTSALKNLLTDIAGVKVGNADDARLASGVTAVLFDRPAVAAIDVRGGGPGTREEAALRPESTVEAVDGFALAGGSALGLDAAGGVQAWLAEQGRGLRIRDAVIPIVPGAILFDLLNGGDKGWGRYPPYRELAHLASERAGADFKLGSVDRKSTRLNSSHRP